VQSINLQASAAKQDKESPSLKFQVDKKASETLKTLNSVGEVRVIKTSSKAKDEHKDELGGGKGTKGETTGGKPNPTVIVQVRKKRSGYRAFSHAAPSLWNDLPLHLRQSDNLLAFRRRLKTHLFSQLRLSQPCFCSFVDSVGHF
jgi:hypothetical protein